VSDKTFGEGDGFKAFQDELGGDGLGGDDDVLWEIALSLVPRDPLGDTDVWVTAVRSKFLELKRGVGRM
jgi:hypothetical protein